MKRYLSIILACLFVQLAWAQSGEGYDPQNPGDPDVHYRLLLEASPKKGGRVSPSSMQQLSAGDSIRCNATENACYTFKQWMVGDKVVSTERNFTYTMPEENVTLIAYFDWTGYNPENPGDPLADGFEHKVTLYATPSAGGNFNSSSFYLAEGKTTNVYAYPRSFYRFVSWKQDGKIVSTSNPMEITMGTENLEYTAQFVYDPVNPGNPGANNFNGTTGELVIDDFEPGRLSSAIYTTLGTDDSYNKVKSITIIGTMQAADFGFLKGMTNCSDADISRTTGYNNVPDYAFEGASSLKTLILPYSVESIGEYAFSGCNNLSTLYCYATTPPSVSSTTFDGVPSSMKVLVPALSLELYQSANYWKNFVLSALDGVTNTLTISLPEDAKDGRYKNMTLELDNITSGQVSRMLITDRTRYSFVNLIHNTKYNVYVKTAKSVVLGEIQDVEIVDKDVETGFTQLKQPQTVTMSVVNGKVENLTESTDITWFDTNGNYLATGNTISGYVDGTVLKYRVKLSNDAALYYVAPQDSTYEIKTAGNEFNCVLTPLQMVTVTGYVKNANTKKGVYDASVSISQQTSGKQSRTVVAKTDVNGKFTAEVYNSPASISCAAFDYVNKTLDVESFTVAEGKVTMDDVMMNSIVGATVNISLTYQESVLEGETPDVQDWYNDYQNLSLSVFNLTTNQEVTQISNRYPQFVLMDGVRVGDELRLTLSSKKSAFTPVVIDKKVDETEEINALFAIKQYGGMHASYQTTSNDAVVGILYDKNGYLQQKSDFANDSTLTFQGLKDGDYTLVTMGKNDVYNSIFSLSRFKELLVETEDYVTCDVNVVSGILRKIDVKDIPFFNEVKYNTIDITKSSFEVNKSSIVAGNYLTFTGVIELKDENITITDNMSLVVDIPASASFVKGSVMVGDKVVDNYTFVDNTLTVPFNNVGQQNKIKFCVIPTIEGTYQPNAMVGFKANGEDVMVPIGANSYNVQAITINVPSLTSKSEIYVNGIAPNNATIDIYDGDIVIGKTQANSAGMWKTNCTLNESYNLLSHNIYAVIETESFSITSEARQCKFVGTDLYAKTVEMSFYNSWLHGGSTVKVVYDLENSRIVNPNYMFYTKSEFSFAIDLNKNNSESIENVLLYVYTRAGYWLELPATYNQEHDKWVTTHIFDWENIPVGVRVEIVPKSTSGILDAEMVDNSFNTIDNLKDEVVESNSSLEALLNEYESYSASGNYDKNTEVELLKKISDFIGVDYTPHNIDYLSEEEIILHNKTGEEILNGDVIRNLDSLLNASIYDLNLLQQYTKDIQVLSCEGISHDELLDLGFNYYEKSDGSGFYIRSNENQYEIVDLSNNIRIVYNNQINQSRSITRAASSISVVESWNANLQTVIADLQSSINTVVNAITSIETKLNAANHLLEKQIGEYFDDALYLHQHGGSKFLIAEKDLAIRAAITAKQANNVILKKLKESVSFFKISAGAGKAIGILGLVQNVIQGSNDLSQVVSLYNQCEPCPGDKDNASQLQRDLVALGVASGAFYVAQVTGTIASIMGVQGGILAAIPTGGTSLTAAGISIAAMLANFAACTIYTHTFEGNISRIASRIPQLKCLECKCEEGKPCTCPKDKCPKYFCKKCSCKNGGRCTCVGKCICEEPEPKSDPQHDPSGYVYEGIFNNRIEGVTTTCYQKIQVEDMYGDLHDNVVKWDAEEYGQENPLHTDKDGFYQWFVPEGLWQVKYEKEGYETAYSEWLPVPPPQLDVNIGIVQNRQPEVKEAHAYEDGVELTFDKYMMPAYLTADNIKVSQNGKYVEGKVVLVDEEVAYRDENVKYASTVRFVPNTAFSAGKEVTLVVANKVKSYAGIQMAENFTQSFDIEKEVKSILADSLVKVPYQGSKVITLYVQPADAATGKTMHAESSSEMLASLVQKDIVIDENGMAQFEIRGELPGTAGIAFSIDGVKTTATVIANVGDFEVSAVNEPKASLVSGSSVYRGTTVKLTADSKDLKIWYTIDGTCPCDENGSRKQYSEPIVINGNVTIKATAENADGEASDVATFIYSILQSKTGVSLNNGWNWVSFNMTNDALSSVNTALASGSWTSDDVVKDNKYVDMYSANQKQWIGTLSKHGALNNVQMYKVRSSKAQTLSLTGEAVHPSETTITLGAGWNYISYLPLVNMNVSDALKGYKAENGDVIKSQDAFATYSTANGWEGDLTTLTVGRGYMLKRSANASQVSFTYPVESFGSSAKVAVSAMSYRYADNMNIIGEVKGISVEDGDSLVAYVNGEMRGTSRLERNKKVFLTVHGDEEAKMAIVLVRDGEIVATASNMIGYQSNNVLGTSDAPTAITFVTDDKSLDGNIGNVKAIYNINGIKMNTKRLNNIPSGTYIIYSEKGGNTCVTKFIK